MRSPVFPRILRISNGIAGKMSPLRLSRDSSAHAISIRCTAKNHCIITWQFQPGSVFARPPLISSIWAHRARSTEFIETQIEPNERFARSATMNANMYEVLHVAAWILFCLPLSLFNVPCIRTHGSSDSINRVSTAGFAILQYAQIMKRLRICPNRL